jgi:hypothetical protein
MKPSIRVVALLSVLLVFSTAQVFAVRPTIEYIDFSGSAFTLPASAGFCPFDIYEEPIGNKIKVATFYGQTGEIKFEIISGMNKWRFTNLSTGKAIELNASGPGRFFVRPGSDTVLAETGGVSFFYILNPPAGIPKLALTRGRVVAELDPTTFVVTNLISHHGTVQDICPMLQ